MLELFVNKYIQDRGVKEYLLEGVSINTDTEIKDNEVIFISEVVGSNVEFISSSEYFNGNSQTNFITQNLGFIKFINSSVGFLSGVKLIITAL